MKSKLIKKPIVRIAPSPTGNFHIGTARTAFFNFLFARKHGGTFIVRSEDTDMERSKREYEDDILAGLAWLGLSYDAFYRQTERIDIYKKHIGEMLHAGTAYVSKEDLEVENDSTSPRPRGARRPEVIRFKNPNRIIKFEDIIRGTISFDTTELGDFVIAKSVDEPLYHLAAVVDDHEMGVTHVIRGEEHLSNTSRQILIQEAIGAERPQYAHLPLILDSDRKKLSKRKHGEAVWIDFYKKQGYLPEALLNFYALLGWNPGTEQELFTLPELIDTFELERVQKSGAIFNIEKLNWMNKEHMKLLPEDMIKKNILELFQSSESFQKRGWRLSNETLNRLWKIIFERISHWGEISDLVDTGEFDYMFENPIYSKQLLLWKDEKDFDVTIRHIHDTMNFLGSISENDFTAESLKNAIWDYATKEGKGAVLWPMRVALSGKEKSPDPFTLAEILGREETLTRLSNATKILQQ